MVIDTEGVVTRKWGWPLPHLRMATPIFFHLNHNISFRCHNKTQMALTFLCHKETAKIQVGQVLMAVEPVTQEDLVRYEFDALISERPLTFFCKFEANVEN